MKLAEYQALGGIALSAYRLGDRAGYGAHRFGQYFHSANKRLSDVIRGYPPLRAVPSNLAEKDMNGSIGPQDNASGTHAGAPFAQKEATTNFSDVSFPISYTGVSDLNITFTGTSTTVVRGQVLFTPTGGTGWNTSFLAPVSNALDVFNYYVLESVEFIWLTNAFSTNATGQSLGHSIFKIIPWTAEYTVGGTFPGTDISLLNGCDTFFVRVVTGNTSAEYEPDAVDFQRTEHTVVKPMYQQNTEPTSDMPNIKAQYARIPLQIASANGIDNTVWYSLLYEFNCHGPANGPITIRAPFMYRVNIGLFGRRFVNVSALFRRQAYLLGNNNMGALSNRTECVSATPANETFQGSMLFRDPSESRVSKQQMRDDASPPLDFATKDQSEKELLPIVPSKRTLGKPFAMLQRQKCIGDDRDLPEIHKGKRTRMEDIGGLRGFTEYFEKDKTSEKEVN